MLQNFLHSLLDLLCWVFMFFMYCVDSLASLLRDFYNTNSFCNSNFVSSACNVDFYSESAVMVTLAFSFVFTGIKRVIQYYLTKLPKQHHNLNIPVSFAPSYHVSKPKLVSHPTVTASSVTK